jgi:hypothetical protein
MEDVGSYGGTCSDGGMLSGLNRECHNQRRPTTNEMAMEQGQQPHAESGS